MPTEPPSPNLSERFSRGISLLAWAYNEELFVEGFLARATALLESVATDYEIVMVNDGSTDKTGQLADDWARRNHRIRVVHHARNLNVGLACRTAVASAQKEYLFWQTVDWSYDLTHLRTFLELLSYYDVVQGVRPVPIRLLSYIPVIRSVYRVHSRSDNLFKAIVSLTNYYILRVLFGVPFDDFQNVTIYPTKLIQALPVKGRSSFINPEFLIRSYADGHRFIEVPIGFIKRSAGQAKGTRLRAILRSLGDITRNWLTWGLRLRLARGGKARGRIDRVSSPFNLPEPVLHICVPLFIEFRRKTRLESGGG
jgi:hypothetical protein